MMRPPFLCSCGSIVPYGTTCQCKRAAIRERNARHDRNRPNATARGYGPRWRKARAGYLLQHPVCVKCSAPADTVDHIVRHRGDPSLFWNQTNWQALCTHCHNSSKQRHERKPR